MAQYGWRTPHNERRRYDVDLLISENQAYPRNLILKSTSGRVTIALNAGYPSY